jgi:hypothetical protein
MRRTGRYKLPLPIGFAVSTLAFVLLSTMTPATTAAFISGALVLLGLSLGICMPILNVAVQNAADPRDLGVAISTVMFSRSLGGTFGVAIFWSLLLSFLGRALPGGLTAGARNALFDGNARLGGLAGGARNVLVDGLAHAFHEVFLVGAGIAVLAMLLALLLREEPLKTTSPSERRLAVEAETAAAAAASPQRV